jgi:hypothetical protein
MLRRITVGNGGVEKGSPRVRCLSPERSENVPCDEAGRIRTRWVNVRRGHVTRATRKPRRQIQSRARE